MTSARKKAVRERQAAAFDKALGERIKARRRELKLGLAELSELIGVAPSTISRWENGLTSCDPATMARLAGALKCKVADLMDGILVGNGK